MSEQATTFAVLIFTEGDYSNCVLLTSKEKAEHYAAGVQMGADLYGSGSCHAHVIPGDEKEMSDIETDAEVTRALADRDAKLKEHKDMEDGL